MNDDFRERYSQFIAPYRVRNLSTDEIYAQAPLRQLKLVSLCFDVCVDKAAASGKVDAVPLMADLDASRLIRATDLCPHDIEALSPDEQKSARKLLTNFLEKNCGILIIIDGDVKSVERFSEKAGEDGSPSYVNDINRLTVVSRHFDLVEAFAEGLQEAVPPEQICAKREWEYKKFGMLSKSNYIMIDGVPAEIHLNEPRQMLASLVLTHHIYEAMREYDPVKFGRLYYALPATIQESLDKAAAFTAQEDMDVMLGLRDGMVVALMQSSNGSPQDKIDCLTELHREAHEAFFNRSSPEWQTAFTIAKLKFNKGLQKPAPATINVTPRLKNG